MRNIKLIIFILILSSLSVWAESTVFEASSFINENNKETTVQSNIESYDFTLFEKEAKEIFNSGKNHLVIKNFPVRPNYKVNLILSKQKSVFTKDIDINYFKDGKKVKLNRANKNKYYGKIEGHSSSDVYISYSSLGLVGFIQDEMGQMYDVSANLQDLGNSVITHSVSETTMGKLLDTQILETCGIDHLPEDIDNMEYYNNNFSKEKNFDEVQKLDLLEVKIATDGNFEFYLMFLTELTGNDRDNWQSWYNSVTPAEKAQAIEMSIDYIENVMSAVSRIYVREVAIVIAVPYITIFNDPFNDPYFVTFGTTLSTKLREMREIWPNRSNEATDKVLATVFTDISRQSVAGTAGIAYRGSINRGVICSNNLGYSALGMRGNVDFPRLSYSSDVSVAAHEFGHNFGCPHTFSCFWVDNGLTLIDSCTTEEGNGEDSDCLDWEDVRTKYDGTIMSYCHNNGSVILNFHPRNRSVIRSNAERALSSCIKEPSEPIVRLVRPLGEEIYFAGTELKIAFNAANVNISRLLYSDDNGENWTEFAKVNTAEDTIFIWSVPTNVGTLNKIRIESVTDASVFDQSELPFLITDFIISSDFPMPNDKVGYLGEQRIKWFRENVSEIRLKLSVDNGKTFNLLTEGDLGFYRYNFPDVATKNAILLIESVDNPSVFREIPFELGREKVVFNSPMINDVLDIIDKSHTIKFNTDFITEEFDIEYRLNETGSWKAMTNFARKVDLENNEFIWNFSNEIKDGDLCELRAMTKSTNELIGESAIFRFKEGVTSVNLTYSDRFRISSITPNPAGNQISLVVNNSQSQLVRANIRIIGVDGKVFKTIADKYMVTGKSTLGIQVHELPVGTYYVMIESDKYKDVQQLKVVR